MKKVQKFKAVYKDGKQESKEAVGKARSFMDSIAEGILIDSERLVKKVEKTKKVLETVELFEEVAEDKPKTKKATK